MTATAQFINVLGHLKTGDLGRLRSLAGQGLDETVDGFDLFAGLWWPLRRQSERAPRREVAWLIAKLYASCPLTQSPGDTLARQIRRCQPAKDPTKEHFRQRFDRMLLLPLNEIESALRWALDTVKANGYSIDWVMLTDDLSQWEREKIRLQWADQYLEAEERA